MSSSKCLPFFVNMMEKTKLHSLCDSKVCSRSQHPYNFSPFFTCKITKDSVWGKLKNPSNFLTQVHVTMNAGLALKEWGGHNGYKVVLSESIANIIQKLLQLIKGHCEHFSIAPLFQLSFDKLIQCTESLCIQQ